MAEVGDVIGAVDGDGERALEYAVFGLEVYVLDADGVVVGDDGHYLFEQAGLVYSRHGYGGQEGEHLLRLPVGGEYAVAVAALEALRHGAFALVDDDLPALVDEAEYGVAGDGLAAVGYLVA